MVNESNSPVLGAAFSEGTVPGLGVSNGISSFDARLEKWLQVKLLQKQYFHLQLIMDCHQDSK
jgi:hypothetical protein